LFKSGVLLKFTEQKLLTKDFYMRSILCSVISLFAVMTSQIQCDEYYPETTDYSFGYATVGVGPIFFIPNVGIGYRQRHAQYGWDTGLSFSTVGYVHQLSAHFAGHYYLDPCEAESTYLGLGLLGSFITTNHNLWSGVTLSPDFIIGRELKNHHFIEMHVAAPTVSFGSHRGAQGFYLPMMYIKYGFAF